MKPTNLTSLQTSLDYNFQDPELLQIALTHRSCLNSPKTKESYERLEFLGDAVLEMLISTFLYQKHPNKMEGFLTAVRSAIVRTESLSQICKENGFNKYILMSKGEELSGGRSNLSILEDVIESLMGAIYLDGGFLAAKAFFDKFIAPKAQIDISEDKLKDPKSLLQELVQAKGLASPLYQTVQEIGPDHSKTFEVEVIVENNPIAKGTGKNKQEAEQAAAKLALIQFTDTK